MTNDAEAQVRAFIGKFDPDHRKLLRQVRKAVRHRFPTAYELVYDNYNFFVLGYGPTERPSDAILSVTGAANGIGLCFIQGATLSDPEGILQGEGNQTRFIRVDSIETLEREAVRDLIDAAEAQSPTPMREKGRVELRIRSISAKQRPRRRSG